MKLVAGLWVVYFTTRPLTIYYDNRATIFFIKNNKSSGGSKYLELKYLIVRDLIKKGDITVEHIDIESILANPLTKALRPICFTRLIENIGILSSFNVFGWWEWLCIYVLLMFYCYDSFSSHTSMMNTNIHY